eukprot:2960-Eustigmatos_ZCMA.PRE.1
MVEVPRRFISAKKKKELLRKAAQEPVVEEAKKSVKGSLPPPPPPCTHETDCCACSFPYTNTTWDAVAVRDAVLSTD